jgi:hypothetical protein
MTKSSFSANSTRNAVFSWLLCEKFVIFVTSLLTPTKMLCWPLGVNEETDATYKGKHMAWYDVFPYVVEK